MLVTASIKKDFIFMGSVVGTGLKTFYWASFL